MLAATSRSQVATFTTSAAHTLHFGSSSLRRPRVSLSGFCLLAATIQVASRSFQYRHGTQVRLRQLQLEGPAQTMFRGIVFCESPIVLQGKCKKPVLNETPLIKWSLIILRMTHIYMYFPPSVLGMVGSLSSLLLWMGKIPSLVGRRLVPVIGLHPPNCRFCPCTVVRKLIWTVPQCCVRRLKTHAPLDCPDAQETLTRQLLKDCYWMLSPLTARAFLPIHIMP